MSPPRRLRAPVHPSARRTLAQPLGAAWMPALALPAAVQEGHDRVHNTAGHQSFRTVLQCRFGSVRCEQPSVVVVDFERPILTASIADEQIAAFALQFRPGVEKHIAVGVAGFRSEPDDGPHIGQLTVSTATYDTREHVVGAHQVDGAWLRGALLDLAGR